jgi:hypothetical protein
MPVSCLRLEVFVSLRGIIGRYPKFRTAFSETYFELFLLKSLYLQLYLSKHLGPFEAIAGQRFEEPQCFGIQCQAVQEEMDSLTLKIKVTQSLETFVVI